MPDPLKKHCTVISFALLALLPKTAAAGPSTSPSDAQPIAQTVVIAPGTSYDAGEADLPITVRLGGGIVFKPYNLTDLEFGSFAESASGGQAAGLDLRRQQEGGELYIGDWLNFGAVWDAGGSPGSRARLLEGQVSYLGLKPVALTAGVFKPQFSIESVQSGSDTFLVERASIVNVTRNVAASSGREAVQVMGSGPRWLASVALTAGLTGESGSGGQRAIVGRVLGLPVQVGDLTLEVGVSGQYVWHPANAAGAGPGVTLSNTIEVAVDHVPPSVSTGLLLARNVTVAGVEASGSWRNLLVQGEYYDIAVARPAGQAGVRFDGGYVQAAYTLAGSPRRWDRDHGVWLPTSSGEGFNPSQGRWGTLEAVVRYSTINLSNLDVHGGRQQTWTVGASYSPVLPLRFLAEFLRRRGWRSLAADGERVC